ncbi:MAG TPA: hypothetical protein ENL07_11550 [Chlorobaculum parvum]|uniref:Uncharacterized protein n=1 Tax=Chlorobaculum parvum TaxID=274539 RepID=A0A7C5DFL6_9CHLB|nr:hypothetical protein [Chlorobaculum parvum]
MIPRIWIRWLYAVTIAIMLLGMSMVLMPGLAREFFSLLFYFAPGGFQARYPVEANEYILFAHGVLGAVMLGWGVSIFLVIRGPFRRRDSDGWALLARPMLVWFAADTGFSFYVGFWQNAILNSVLLMLFAIPLAATRSCFREEK